MRLFNKDLDITVREFKERYNTYMDIPLNRWVNKENMTDKERSEVEGWEAMGGYLKTLGFKEACRVWWEENPRDHRRFTSLPGFDAQIFEEITGIDVEESDTVDITVEGKTKTISRQSAKELNLI